MGSNRLDKDYNVDRYLEKKINKFTVIITLILMVIFTYSMYLIFNFNKVTDKANLLRVEVSDQKEAIKEMYIKNNFYNSDDFNRYAVVDLKGEVLFSTIDNLNGKINLEGQVGYDNAFDIDNSGFINYSTPLVIDNEQKAIIILQLDKSLIEKEGSFYEIFILMGLILFTIIIVIMLNKFMKIDVIKPIKQLHKTAKSILKGNYNEEISYDYHGEIGGFCHDFELMRDELKVSKEVEERLKRSEKELLACISHDLKTPLSSISGYVEGIRDGIVKDENGIRRYSEIILRKSKDLSRLIDDILEQSKTELNEMNFNKEELYADNYFIGVLDEISLDICSNNMNLIVEGEIPRVLISIDKGRINQVLGNIITNSIKYAKAGRDIKVIFKDKIGEIEVNIQDYGIGIGMSDLPFVFNKFYRAEKQRNTNIPGSGLGLSIAKFIVENHGGKIKCNSAINEGTTITFTIPKS